MSGTNITLTEAAVAVPEFWANVALGALKSNTVMAQLVNRDYENVVATKGDTINITQRGALAVNDKEINTQIKLQNPANSKIPVKLNKHKEISWLIEDATSAKAIDDALNYVMDAAIAMGEQMDKDLLSSYSLFANAIGVAGNEIDIDTILAVREKMNVLRCPTRGRVIVLSPKDETALLKLEEFTSAQWDDTNAVALQEATIGRKYGFTFVMDQNVIETGASPKSTHCMALTRDALTLVTRPLPAPPPNSGASSSIIEVDGITVRVTHSYSQRDGGVIWTLDCLYGVAGLRTNTHGIHLLT